MKVKEHSVKEKSGVSSAGIKIKEIMTPDVETVGPEDSLQAAACKMQERNIGFLPVCDGRRLVGVVSDRDITIRAVAAGKDPTSTPVREFATARTVWCYDDEDVDQAAERMKDSQIRRLMVLSRPDKELVGVVSLGDLAANGPRTEEASNEVLEHTSPAVDRTNPQ